MCQLTLAHFKDKELNALYIMIQALKNTETSHKDGFGYFDGKKIHKWDLTPHSITNLKEIIYRGATDRPMISHVRLATRTNGKSEISPEKSHPFLSESGKLVLAHNGSLEFDNTSKMRDKKYKDMIDTEIFLSVLDSYYQSNGDLPNSLELAMAEFRGKFAFLMYEVDKDMFWIARGLQARLHYSTVHWSDWEKEEEEKDKEKQVMGLVVNTDETALKLGLRNFLQIAKLIHPDLRWWYEEPKLLESNTLFKVEEDSFEIKKVGDLKENAKVWAQSETGFGAYTRPYHPIARGGGDWQGTRRGNHTHQTIYNSLTADPEELALLEVFQEFLESQDFTIEEMDELFLACTDSPLLYASPLEAGGLSRLIFPFLASQNSGNKRKLWKKLGYASMPKYTKTGVNFPFMLNYPRELKRALAQLKKQEKNK